MLPERAALSSRPPPRIGARTQLATFQVLYLKKLFFEKLGRTLLEEEEEKSVFKVSLELVNLGPVTLLTPSNFVTFFSSFFFLTK